MIVKVGSKRTIYIVGESNAYLIKVDPVTRIGERVGTAHNFDIGETSPQGLAYNTKTNTMYMVGETNRWLYKLNLLTGVATRVGSSSGFGIGARMRGLCYDVTRDRLWAISSTTQLHYIDMDSGIATPVGSPNTATQAITNPQSMLYDSDSDNLFIGGEAGEFSTDPDDQQPSGARVGLFLINKQTGSVEEDRFRQLVQVEGIGQIESSAYDPFNKSYIFARQYAPPGNFLVYDKYTKEVSQIGVRGFGGVSEIQPRAIEIASEPDLKENTYSLPITWLRRVLEDPYGRD